MTLPHGIFFAILLINTVYSVRFFGPMIHRDGWQWAADATLLSIYGLLMWSLGDSVWFSFFVTILFIVATLKYVLGRHSIPSHVLHRKVIIDLSGALMGSAALGASLLGYANESAWVLAGVFALANMYLLFIRPMYRT